MVYNPFKVNNNDKNYKENARDPLDVRELLTDNTRKAIITGEGELQLENPNSSDAKKIELMKERYWGISHQALIDQRISIETREMTQKFPKFQLRKAESSFVKYKWTVAQAGEKFWIGNLTTYSKNIYTATVVYPKDYPFSEIRSYILEPFIPTTEHRFKDGHLCLYGHEGNGEGYETGKTTAITILAWTAAWLHAYEIWRVTGEWPTIKQ